ncbi:hypothetical protein MOTT16_12335 [Moraxella osloensis]|uniref:Uncharacterized protein n=1 Tax=Faucicola osloensis TaxID=34062 RepID=A0AAD2PRM4_FAUOS|nr:hypothetical protein [Moraxella osloensis]ATW70833.1 hypothetical protein YHS_12345 [Moraxella osloensis]ATY49534.1 hypothetical protein MOTT16_12335 [Moraxella osloensis]
MSGFAFSHQFSKRWLATPTPVKHAIIQELDDIVTLLYPDTDLDEYQFSVPNLHDKVEELLAIERDHQEKLQAQAHERELEEQRLEQERLAQQRLEQERLETERLEKERLEQQRLEQQHLEQIQLTQENEKERQAQEERLQRERQAQDDAAIALLEQERAIAKQAHLAKQANPPQPATQLSTGSIEGANHELDEQVQSTDTATSDVTIERHRSEMVYAIDHTDTADNTDNIAEPLADDPTVAVMTHETSVTEPLADIDNPSIATTPAIEQIKQDIVKQLQGYIDNYLLESMTLMNEDLNQWLKTEVEKQLTVRLSQSHQSH